MLPLILPYSGLEKHCSNKQYNLIVTGAEDHCVSLERD